MSDIPIRFVNKGRKERSKQKNQINSLFLLRIHTRSFLNNGSFFLLLWILGNHRAYGISSMPIMILKFVSDTIYFLLS